MDFRILGPLELSVNGRPIPVRGTRQRKLLALLLINADRAVSFESLVDTLWEESPPATAKRQIQNCVSATRLLLERATEAEAEAGDDAPARPSILCEGRAYHLRLAQARLDEHSFSDQVEQARRQAEDGLPELAAMNLRAALGLWRGPALAGLGGQVLEAAAARLDERRWAATERCIDLELRLGRHADLVGELTELVSTHPLRERLVGQLMLALSRSGRQADALAVYRTLQSRLADELGVEPAAQIQELHHSVLRHETHPATTDEPPAAPAVAVPQVPGPPIPAQLPCDVPGFIGRAEQIKELDELLDTEGASIVDGPAGSAMVRTLAGPAGSGKTALAVHWGHRVRHHFPDGQLYVNLRGFDPTGRPVDPSDALRDFLDALAVPPHRIPAELPARAALYRSLLAEKRMLVVLDNARDAGQVRALLPGSPLCPVLLTSRDLLTGLIAAEGARPCVVGLFDPAEARQMLTTRLGRARTDKDPRSSDEIAGLCARLPLALAVVAARAASHPHFSLAEIAAELRSARSGLEAFTGHDPSTDVRAVFSWSYRQLTGPAQRLFRLLALVPGTDTTTSAAASLAGLPVPETQRWLGELVGASLVTEHHRGRFTFHDLHRAFAGELVQLTDGAPERRRALHRLLDHLLHTACAADRLLDAHRDPITLDPVAADVLVERFADHDEAMRWFTAEQPGLVAAVERAQEAGFDRHTWRLAWALAYFHERRGMWQPWAAVQEAALSAARGAGEPEGAAQAHRGLGRAKVHLGQVDDARRHFDLAQELFRTTGDLAGQARIHFDLCWISYREGRHQSSLEHAQQALELFRAANHRSGEARALNNIAWGFTSLGNPRQALAAGEEAHRLNVETEDLYGDADSWDVLGHAHQQLGNLAESIACHQRAADLYRRLGHRWAEADTLDRLGDAHLAAGEPRQAREAWSRAVRTLDELRHPDAARLRAKLA